MGIQLSKEAIHAISDPDSIKVLASVSKEGVPHVAVKQSIQVDQEGRIRLLELLEKSQSQKNLVHAIWFGKKVAINVITKHGKSFLIKGTPYKAITGSHIFQEAYTEVQKTIGKDVDLSAIWIIDPEEEREDTFWVRRDELEREYPYELHVDRLAREEYR